jgi:broad specificity phosphatase PhoE
MTGMTMVYLVQHGDKQPGPGEPGLTELGRMQATRTGRWLGGLGAGALWTSPMRRARETAECIAAVTGLAVQADARLRERLNWDGSTPWEAFADLWARTADDRDLVPERGQSARQAGARLQAFLVSLRGLPGRSRRSPTAESRSSCCAPCSARMPCRPACWPRASRRAPAPPWTT